MSRLLLNGLEKEERERKREHLVINASVFLFSLVSWHCGTVAISQMDSGTHLPVRVFIYLLSKNGRMGRGDEEEGEGERGKKEKYCKEKQRETVREKKKRQTDRRT